MPEPTQPEVERPGQWRLDRIELVNWGTFHGHHVIDVPRRGFLLTGHSGSGKSSVVDAVTAVLTPRLRASFNAAAADGSGRGGDRSVLTYVRGAHSRIADEDSGEITTQYLRPPRDASGAQKGGTWSGILLRYSDGHGREGRQSHLVKLFHAKRGASTAAEVSELHLFTAQPVDLMELQPYAKNGLKEREIKQARPEAYVHKQHARFAARFARALGITGERATLLLHRTQSAKNLGSLDDLFRGFMLDEPETFSLADRAVDQFAELSEAHRAVVRAREQIAHLDPLEQESRAYDDAGTEEQQAHQLAEALEDFTHGWKLDLTIHAKDEAELAVDDARAEQQGAAGQRASAEARVRDAQAAVDSRGGNQLETLEEKIQTRRERLADTEARLAELTRRLESVELPVPANQAEMARLHRSAEQQRADGSDEAAGHREAAEQLYGQRARAQQRIEEITAELDSMKRSRSNVGTRLLSARRRIAEAVGIGEKSLPFAAELLQVRSEHADWTGAIERVLRPLGTVLLVSAAQEFAVTAAVDSHHLGARVRLETIPVESPAPGRPGSEDSLVYRVEVAETAPAGVRDWVQHQLARRFDYRCVDTAEELAGIERGVTRAGQVKRGHRSYEKDDSHRIDDPSRWILGFDNEQKVEHYLTLHRAAEQELAGIDRELGKVLRAEEARRERDRALEEIRQVEWPQVDAAARRQDLQDAEQARTSLLAADGDLRTAQAQLAQAQESAAAVAATEHEASRALAAAEASLENLTDSVLQLQAHQVPEVPEERREVLRDEFAAHRTQRSVTHQSIDMDARRVSNALHARIQTASARQSQAAQRITQITLGFRSRWPAAAGDLSAELESRSGYLEILSSLRADRLPDFEQRFFRMLREQSQQNIGLLAERIRSAPREIRRRVDPINESLLRSQFAPGRYLQIQVQEARPTVVKDFLADLNTITTGALAVEEEPAEAERRFEVLARVMAQLGSSDAADRTWRRQCLDTRRHVRFLGVEQDVDGTVVDWYDSGRGRSGGQKQKLVVFCLAAALRYQLTRQTEDIPGYASIVMDEAFDKADARFTRMALDIFEEFGFHMILATPLKMLQVMEDYVGGMALVTCPDGKHSYASPVTFEDQRVTAAQADDDDGGTDEQRSQQSGQHNGQALSWEDQPVGTLFEVDR